MHYDRAFQPVGRYALVRMKKVVVQMANVVRMSADGNCAWFLTKLGEDGQKLKKNVENELAGRTKYLPQESKVISQKKKVIKQQTNSGWIVRMKFLQYELVRISLKKVEKHWSKRTCSIT